MSLGHSATSEAPPADESRIVEPPRPRILVVDDELHVLEMLNRLLQRSGGEVITANNGQAGLDILHNSSDGVHALVTDTMMPERCGPEMIREAGDRLNGVFVTSMSGGFTGDSGHVQKRLLENLLHENKVHGFFKKPPLDFARTRAGIITVARSVAADPALVQHLGGLLESPDSEAERVRLAALPEGIRDIVRLMRASARAGLADLGIR